MNRREFLRKAPAGSAALRHASSAQQTGESKRDRPNILHIMSDMRRWETVANRSPCNTPHLDRLAEDGILFNRSYSATVPCGPARAMLATGSYHWHNGIYTNVHAPPAISRDMFPHVVTYYQRLRDVGYHLGYVGKWHASYTRTPLDFGFHELRAPLSYNPQLVAELAVPLEWKKSPPAHSRVTITRHIRFPGSEPFAFIGYSEQEEEETLGHYLADRTISMIQRFKESAPWLIEMHFPESARRYPLRRYRDRYQARDMPVPPSFHDSFEDKPGLHRMEAEAWAEATEDDVRESRASYYAAFEQQDVQIGRVLQALEETGQKDNTVVTFSVDHGEMGGAHHMWGTGWMIYEENYRVPMVVRWPGRIRPGTVSNNLVQVHDLAHTYIDVAGAERLLHRGGSSLLPLFDDPADGFWTDHIYNAFYGQEFLYVIRMAVTERYKYVFNSFDIDECYDLQEDPHEMHNRVKDSAFGPIVDDMRARIYELMVQTEDPYGDNPPAPSRRRRASRALAPRYLPRGKRLGK